MNDLITTTKQLPDTLPELTKFVLVGREKLASVRAEIRAIQKVGLAKEVLEQKKAEAQEIAELVTLSEVQIGKMLKAIPKAKGGAPFHSTPDTFVDSKPHTKAETLRDQKGLNNAQVAVAAGIPMSTIYDWGAGRYMPKMDKLQAIAKVLEVTLEELVSV